MRNNLGQVVTASWFNYCVVDFLPFLRGLTPLVHLSASRSKDNSISDNIKIKIRCLVCTVGWRNQWQRLESDDVVSTRCCHMSHNTESVISKKNEWLTTDISRFNPIRLFSKWLFEGRDLYRQTSYNSRGKRKHQTYNFWKFKLNEIVIWYIPQRKKKLLERACEWLMLQRYSWIINTSCRYALF